MKALMELISLGCRLYLAWLFLWASYDKVWEPAAFALDMAKYDILPVWTINAASVSMAWMELLCGGFLLIGFMHRAAAFWMGLMLLLFTGLMIYAGFTGAGFDCGCFPGQESHPQDSRRPCAISS
jgi:putative oxidoreductase